MDWKLIHLFCIIEVHIILNFIQLSQINTIICAPKIIWKNLIKIRIGKIRFNEIETTRMSWSTIILFSWLIRSRKSSRGNRKLRRGSKSRSTRKTIMVQISNNSLDGRKETASFILVGIISVERLMPIICNL